MIYKQVVFMFNFGVTAASNGKESYTNMNEPSITKLAKTL